MQVREFRLQRPDGGLAKRKGWLFTQETFPAWAKKRRVQEEVAEDGVRLRRVSPFLQAQSTETFPGWLRKTNPAITDAPDDALRRPAWFQNVIVAVIPPLPCPYLPSRLLTDSTSSPVRGSAPADTFSSRPAPDANSAPVRKTECR